MIDVTQNKANKILMPLIDETKEKIEINLNNEIERLEQLKKLNNTIRKNEIDFFHELREKAHLHLDEAYSELKAIRVIINT